MNHFTREERRFLRGRNSRWQEFKYTISTVRQFIRGFRALHFIGPCITIFGSARFKDDHPFYIQTHKIAAALSELGFTILTGGGPGIMEAANRGAKDAGGLSIGCNIVLPMEQKENPFLDKFVNIEFFFVRKELLRKYSYAFVVMPGGFGTLDEFFETLTLIQTRKIESFPMVIVGVEWHQELINHIKKMEAEGTISKEDLSLILYTDSVQEVIEHIQKFANINPELQKSLKPMWLLGESKVKLKINND